MDDDVRHELTLMRLRTQSDVHRMWELVMQPLGFGSTSLWFTFVDDRDAPLPMVVELAEIDESGFPSGDDVAHLYSLLEQASADPGGIASVAFLITRPGRGGILETDRRLAALLLGGARRSRLGCQPIHVAHDLAILTITPDDLAA